MHIHGDTIRCYNQPNAPAPGGSKVSCVTETRGCSNLNRWSSLDHSSSTTVDMMLSPISSTYSNVWVVQAKVYHGYKCARPCPRCSASASWYDLLDASRDVSEGIRKASTYLLDYRGRIRAQGLDTAFEIRRLLFCSQQDKNVIILSGLRQACEASQRTKNERGKLSMTLVRHCLFFLFTVAPSTPPALSEARDSLQLDSVKSVCCA